MNTSSILLCLVFIAIGYVIHPTLLPLLLKSKMVSDSSLSEKYKQKRDQANTPATKPDADDVIQDNELPTNPTNPIQPEVEQPPVTPEPEPEVIPEPEPEPEVIPEPEPEPEPVVKLTKQEVITILKSSVRDGDVSEFDASQVTSWEHGDEEVIGIETYDVGLVTYKADTIFDVQELEAKALIKDGSVVKWLWPKTNTEMR